MKKRITLEQLDELSEKAIKKLREWWKPQFGDVYLYDDAEGYFVDKDPPAYDKVLIGNKERP